MVNYILLPNQLFEIKHLPYGVKHIYLFKHEKFYSSGGVKYSPCRLEYINKCIEEYIDYLKQKKISYTIINKLNKNINAIAFDPVDHDIIKIYEKYSIEIIDTPQFLLTREECYGFINQYGKTKPKDKPTTESKDTPSPPNPNSIIQMPSMAVFYKFMRNKLQIYMKQQTPLYGKYSFDEENRNPLPKDYLPTNNLQFATNHRVAKRLLKLFVLKRLENFGPYQDAIHYDQLVYHSALSPMINNGLLIPIDILTQVLKISPNKKNYSSLEGYIRQLIGWREYMRIIYLSSGENFKCKNQFGNKKSLSKEWFMPTEYMKPIDEYQLNKTTGKPIDRLINKSINKSIDKTTNNTINRPIDRPIKRSIDKKYYTTGITLLDYYIQYVEQHGYLNHIIRLMLIGCYLFMKETKPSDVYTWFMVKFLDAYDWVMFGNVYYMSQFTEPFFTKRPYICSSNYINRMSNGLFSTNDQNEWDSIYKDFVIKHQHQLKHFYMMYPHIKKAKSIKV